MTNCPADFIAKEGVTGAELDINEATLNEPLQQLMQANSNGFILVMPG